MKHPRPVNLTPPAISTRTFAIARKGYQPNEVRAYLAELEAAIVEWTEAADQPTPSAAEAAAEAEQILQAARQRADTMIRGAEARAAVIAQEPASSSAGDRWEEVGDHARRVLQQAEHQAQNIVQTAQAQVAADTAAAAADRAEAAEVLRRARAEAGQLQAVLDHLQEAQTVAAHFLTTRADRATTDLPDPPVDDRASPARAPTNGARRVPVAAEAAARLDPGRRTNGS